MRLDGHKINANGTRIDCNALPDAPCRTMPDCDTGTFDSKGCFDHDPAHPSTPGHDCWAIEWINGTPDMELWEHADDWATGDLPIIPGRPVVLTPHGDEGVTWSYANPPKEARP